MLLYDFGFPMTNFGCSPSDFGPYLYDFGNLMCDFLMSASVFGAWTGKLGGSEPFIEACKTSSPVTGTGIRMERRVVEPDAVKIRSGFPATPENSQTAPARETLSRAPRQ